MQSIVVRLCALAVFAMVACSTTSPPATSTPAVTSPTVVAEATRVEINGSLSITIPAGYRLSDGSPIDDTQARLYAIDAIVPDLQPTLDKYYLVFYPQGSNLPFGFGASPLDSVLESIKKDLENGRYVIEASEANSTADGDVIRIRARRSSSKELTQEFFLLRHDQSLVSLGGGAGLSRVPESRQLQVFDQLATSLSTK